MNLLPSSIFLTGLFFSLASLASDSTFDSWESNGSSCSLNLDEAPYNHWLGSDSPSIDIAKTQSLFENWAAENLPENQKTQVVSYNFTSVRTEKMATNHWL